MKFSRLQYVAIALTVCGALLAGAAIAMAQPQQGVPSARGKSAPTPDQSKQARAARAAAREKRNDASWSAFTAARHEPRAALKGISMTRSVKSETGFITEHYLDRFEELDKANKIAYYTATDTSTIMTDIATMRLEQRAALRATLTKVQRVQFDSNVVALVSREGAL